MIQKATEIFSTATKNSLGRITFDTKGRKERAKQDFSHQSKPPPAEITQQPYYY